MDGHPLLKVSNDVFPKPGDAPINHPAGHVDIAERKDSVWREDCCPLAVNAIVLPEKRGCRVDKIACNSAGWLAAGLPVEHSFLKGIIMKVLIIFNREPYDMTDVSWNGLRLAGTLLKNGHDIRLFLMNDAVDMARDVCKPPQGYDQDLVQMLKELIADGATVRVCGTCMTRCGIHANQPYFDGAEKSTMQALSEWVIDSDKVLTF